MKCPHIKCCPFRRAYGYCIKVIGEECYFYDERGKNNGKEQDDPSDDGFSAENK